MPLQILFIEVDFLINYAGGALKVAPIEEMDDAINQRIIELNLFSAIMSCRTFTPQFKEQGFGKQFKDANLKVKFLKNNLLIWRDIYGG